MRNVKERVKDTDGYKRFLVIFILATAFRQALGPTQLPHWYLSRGENGRTIKLTTLSN
jgi:hypothetical protein